MGHEVTFMVRELIEAAIQESTLGNHYPESIQNFEFKFGYFAVRTLCSTLVSEL